jgi:hypothetical protein
MLYLIGTLPFKNLEIVSGSIEFNEGKLSVGDLALVPHLGTAAMAAAACSSCKALGIDPPCLFTAGDTGDASGSTKLYRYLSTWGAPPNASVLCMHYLMPNITHIKMAVSSLRKGTDMTIIADAGSMYAAKAAAIESSFDIFTPDAGEMAYLADPDATHPAYVKHLLFTIEPSEIETLIQKAYENGNLPQTLLVKGPVDYIVNDGRIVQTVDNPSRPAMEAIGGTGDSLTGILCALIAAGINRINACILAARVNRIAGELAHSNPATSVGEIIAQIPNALKEVSPCV